MTQQEIGRRSVLGGALAAAAAASLPVVISSAPAAAAGVGGPRVQSLSHRVGRLVGGTRVVLAGHGLDSVKAVRFGGRKAEIVHRTPRALTVRTPHQKDYAEADVRIVLVPEQGAKVRLDDRFRYRTTTAVDRQLAYAFTYWNDYNIEPYGRFDEFGGDCTNFVSQTLVARGWPMTPAWHNRGGTFATTTQAWIAVPDFEAWLRRHRKLRKISDAHRGRVKIGDIAFFDLTNNGIPDHTMVVSDIVRRRNGRIDLRFVGHDIDYRYRDLDTEIAKKYHHDFDVWYYSVD
jgi:hypothetical protein